MRRLQRHATTPCAGRRICAVAGFLILVALAGCGDDSGAHSRSPATRATPLPSKRPAGLHEIPRPAGPEVRRVESLNRNADRATTRFGVVSVTRSHPVQVLLDGVLVASVPGRSIALSQRAEYADRDVVVGYVECASDAALCEFPQPFWLVLRAGSGPRLLRFSNLLDTDTRPAIEADAAGVHVGLGVWDGSRRRATLGADDVVRVALTQESPQRAKRNQCRAVARALEHCSRSRRCESFDTASEFVPVSVRQDVSMLFHTSTYFNADNFVAACRASCRLALTPSGRLISTEICGGAVPRQWTRADLAWLPNAAYGPDGGLGRTARGP
jgi:hypothetical protein